jgi:hypothetical protein
MKFMMTIKNLSFINNLSLPNSNKMVSDLDFSPYKVDWYIIVFLSFLYGLISLISIFGNALIIWAVVNNKKMKNVTNYFIINLAVADIIIGVLVAPFQFQSALLQKWIFPSVLCKIAPFASTLSVNVSIFTLVAISIDRYFVILYPFNEKLTMKQCYLILIFIWLLSVMLGMTKLFNFNADFDLNINVLVCGPNYLVIHKYDTIFLLIIQYIIPFILILFTYTCIGFHIYTHEPPSSISSLHSINKKKVNRKICGFIF